MNLKGKERIPKKTVLTIKHMLKEKKSDVIMFDKTHIDTEVSDIRLKLLLQKMKPNNMINK
jgi:hypothetical protein